MNSDGATVARSESRASFVQSPAPDKAHSLVRRSIAPNNTRPSDVLAERFIGWKAIVKQLIAYFEGLADIQNNIARDLAKLCNVIQVPFRTGHHFLGEGGLQDIYYGIRDRTRSIADQHANFAKTIHSSIVQHLQRLKQEIDAHIKNVQNDTGRLATNVTKEREASAKLISELSKKISMFKNTPMSITAKDDPYVVNLAVIRQLQKQVHEENSLQKSVIIMQENSATFEEGVVRAIQSAWQTYDDWQSRMDRNVQDIWHAMRMQLSSLPPEREWESYSSRTDCFLDPATPLRNPDSIAYPNKEDTSVVPVHSGFLQRKKRVMRNYREAFYVLTPAGFLHEFASPEPMQRAHPVFSLFLPSCTLGPPSERGPSRSHKFTIEGRQDGMVRTVAGMHINSSPHTYVFRCRSREQMMEWWNDIRMLCARYLVASEHVERSGPVAAAVRAVGYAGEGEEEGEEVEGSSIEEEVVEDDDADMYPSAQGDAGQEDAHTLPTYNQPSKASGLEYDSDGYLVEKKGIIHGNEHGNSNGASISRSQSKRQQEKSPEKHVRLSNGSGSNQEPPHKDK